MSRIEISKKLVLINSASSAVVLVLNLTVLIWLQQYLLKRISPDEYALLPLVMAVMAFSPLLTMVLTGGLGRYITVAYARGDDDEITRICSTMFPLLLAGGGAFLAIGWFAAWHIDSLLEINPDYLGDARLMMALLVFSAAIRLPLAAFGSGFVVRQKLMLQDMIDVGCQLVRIALLFALLFGFGAKVMWVTVALVTSELLNLAISTPLSIRLVPAQRVRLKLFSSSLARELTGYGGWGVVNQLGEIFKQTMDPIILNRFSSSLDVSMYYLGGIVPRQLRLMMGPLTRPFIPVLAAFHATGDISRLRNTYLRTARYQAWVSILVAIPAGVFGNELMLLYVGDRYATAGLVLALLLLVGVLNSFNALGVAVAAAIGEMRGIAVRMFCVQLASIGLGLVVVWQFQQGAVGLAVVSVVTTLILESIVVWSYCRRLVSADIRVWIAEVVAPAVAPAILPLVFCIVCNEFSLVHSWLSLIYLSAASALMYVLLIYLFGLRPTDRIDLATMLNSALKRRP